MSFIARICCILKVNMELCYVRTISSLQLGIKKKIKAELVLNMQQSPLQTAVLLRKWGRGDKHPPTCVYNFSEDDKSYCPSYFFTFQVQGPNSPWLYEEGPYWSFFLHSHAEQFTPQITHIFSCVLTRLYKKWLQSHQPAFLRCFCTLWGKTGSSGAHSWN